MSAVAVARYFGIVRGKALALSGLGHPVGEGIFPSIGVALMVFFGWRGAWWAAALGLLVVLVPIILWSLRGHADRHAQFVARETEDALASLTRRDLLTDRRFLLRLPAIMSIGMVHSGIFFIQVPLAEAKGWSLPLFASGFAALAVASVVGSLITGPLIDRLGAVRLQAILLLPLVVGLAWLALSDAPFTIFAFMTLVGLSSGASGAVSNAVWAELYGVMSLGLIRSVAFAIIVVGTALAPLLTGWTIDAGISVDLVVGGFALYGLVAMVLVPFAGGVSKKRLQAG